MKWKAILVLCWIYVSASGQANNSKASYFAEEKILRDRFDNVFYPNSVEIFSLPEKQFIEKIDSLRAPFDSLLNRYKKDSDPAFLDLRQTDYSLLMDRWIVFYPFLHYRFTKSHVTYSNQVRKRLALDDRKLNKPAYLKLEGYNSYLESFLHDKTDSALKTGHFTHSDNQKLDATFAVVPLYLANKKCRDYVGFTSLKTHIENFGIKDIDKSYSEFIAGCKDTAYTNTLRSMYNSELAGRKDHLILTYKTVDGFYLDIHLYLPDSTKFPSNNKAAMVYFHGGSWTEGKPDWFFGSCRYDAEHGKVAAAVEYRIGDRHGSLPFESVKDAKSAIRWMRANAGKYHFSPDKIIASGNSAGGHVILCAALLDDYNESTDDLTISAKPDLLMVNSGVYDLTVGNEWLTALLGNNPDSVKAISPSFNMKKISQPILLIHGTEDNNVPYWTAAKFAKAMKELNNTIELRSLQGSGHFFWYDPKYMDEMNKARGDFLEANGIR
jgi:acetyl esterase/lipase